MNAFKSFILWLNEHGANLLGLLIMVGIVMFSAFALPWQVSVCMVVLFFLFLGIIYLGVLGVFAWCDLVEWAKQ